MSSENTLTVHDHSEPCEHRFHKLVSIDGVVSYQCDQEEICPGGREIVLRKERFWPETSVTEPCDVWVEVPE